MIYPPANELAMICLYLSIYVAINFSCAGL